MAAITCEGIYTEVWMANQIHLCYAS